MYNVTNSTAYINGSSGAYDGKTQNTDVKYGQNAADNNFSYLNDYTKPCNANYPDLSNLSKLSKEEFEAKMKEGEEAINKTNEWLNSLPPLEFEYRYMPEGGVNKLALMGAAYREMGSRTEMPTQELTGKLQEAFGQNVCADALDINGDNKIDVGEYSTSILLADILSSDSEKPSISDANGVISNKGQNKILPYANKNNFQIAQETYNQLYKHYDIENAKKEFLNANYVA